MRDLAGRFEHRLFLSATPHNGHSNSFSTLLELLDPYRFTRGVKVRGKKALEDVMVRRLKEDIRAVQGGFPKRDVVPEVIDRLPDDAPELVLSRLLDEYRTAREKRLASTTRRAQAAAGLLVVGLQQRLLSSIEAFARSLKVHRATVQKQWEKGRATETAGAKADASDLQLFTRAPDADDERSEWTAEELEAEEIAQIEAVTAAAEADASRDAAAEAMWRREQELLDEMEKIAGKSRHMPEAKTRRLIDWIRDNLCQELPPFGRQPKGAPPKWNNRRVLIFTENREGTKRYLKTILEQAIEGTDRADERIEVIDGLTSGARRKEIQQRFNTHPAKDPLRILLATDAAREGLNFQAHCTDLFHFDLPWNPGRIEQRNGRIDRKLQPAPNVWCHYFVLPQRVEDRVLEVLVKKTETIKRELGSLSKVIDDDIERRLGQGIRHRDADRLAREIEDGGPRRGKEAGCRRGARGRAGAPGRSEGANRALPEPARRLSELDGLRASALPRRAFMLPRVAWCRTAERRAPARTAGESGRFPRSTDARKPTQVGRPLSIHCARLARRTRSSPTGAARRPSGRSSLKMRVCSPRKPFTSTSSSGLRSGFWHVSGPKDLSFTICRVPASRKSSDSIPRVILLGRLSLYGQGAERLHEELVPITTRWVEPSQRKGSFQPFARDAEAKTLDLLERSLGDGVRRMPGEAIQRKLLDAAASRYRGTPPRAYAARPGAGRDCDRQATQARGARRKGFSRDARTPARTRA